MSEPAELLTPDGMISQLHREGQDAGSDFNDGDGIQGWFDWTVDGDILTVTHELDDPHSATSHRWRLVPIEDGAS